MAGRLYLCYLFMLYSRHADEKKIYFLRGKCASNYMVMKTNREKYKIRVINSVLVYASVITVTKKTLTNVESLSVTVLFYFSFAVFRPPLSLFLFE